MRPAGLPMTQKSRGHKARARRFRHPSAAFLRKET